LVREAVGLKDDEHFRNAYLQAALEAGLIEKTIPDKPRSIKQRYRLAGKGRELVDATRTAKRTNVERRRDTSATARQWSPRAESRRTASATWTSACSSAEPSGVRWSRRSATATTSCFA
jgi:hypothetical protein